MQPNEWISVATLGNLGGVVFAVTLIVQFLKGPMDKVMKTPTRVMVLVTAWLVLIGRQFVMSGHLEAAATFLDFLNGFLVALTAMGAHVLAKDKLNWK